MPKTRLPLLLFAALALLGAGIALLASLGDASVMASTGGIQAVLAERGLADDQELPRKLYDVVLRLQGPWGAVQLAGVLVLALGVVGMVTVWRRG
jgi:hypothetical protein